MTDCIWTEKDVHYHLWNEVQRTNRMPMDKEIIEIISIHQLVVYISQTIVDFNTFVFSKNMVKVFCLTKKGIDNISPLRIMKLFCTHC